MAFTLYTIAEAAKELKIKKETLRNRVKMAKLGIHKVGSLHVITKDDLQALKDMGEPRKGRHPKNRIGNKH
jgi:excisionase family DNA binding protein